MTSARRFFNIITPRISAEDYQEVVAFMPWCQPYLDAGINLIKSRRDEAEPKTGKLAGCLSHAFWASPKEPEPSGRIVYRVKGLDITILAIHYDHDEAYRRARKRV